MCLEHTAETVQRRLRAADAPLLSRRSTLRAAAAGLAVAALPATAGAATGGRGRRHWPPSRLVDLTHPFTTDFPTFIDGERPTRRTHVTIPDDGYYLQEWTFYEHSATHLDAPGHFTPGGRLSPDIDPRDLLTPVVVIDISHRARRDPDTEVRIADLRAFERRHGRIPRRAAVCMDSGWARKADDEDRYRGTDADGAYHFPGFGVDAVEWLLQRRQITSIGVDTLSLDPGRAPVFDVHVTLLGADRYGLENLANLGRLPPHGAWLFVGLVPWEEGSGGPCRVLAGW